MLTIIGALIIGLSLGLFGSGGSILTVPVLLYLLGQEPKIAIASSLLIVAGISLLASLPNLRRGIISWRHVLFFGGAGMVGTYGGAWLGVLLPSWVQLTVFAVLMAIAAVLMWRKRTLDEALAPQWRPGKVLLEGVVVGVITGFVGVGGGFLIVPALVLLGGLSMTAAVATSLVVIALKSVVGFAKYYYALSASAVFDWQAIALMVVAGFIGSLVGRQVGKHIPTQPLQRAFAVFLLVMAAYVLWQSW